MRKFYEKKFLVKKFLRMNMFYPSMILMLKKKIHALVIPKGEYIDLDDFNQKASDEEIVALSKAITEVSKILDISTDTGKGYRALTNLGEHGGQEVPHLHFHLFGGEKIGKMVE